MCGLNFELVHVESKLPQHWLPLPRDLLTRLMSTFVVVIVVMTAHLLVP